VKWKEITMSRDKQIEKMAKVLCGDYGECKKCTLSNPECENPCMIREDCEMLYNQGYRKASDVAREIFEEIERFLYMHFRFCKEEIGNDDTEYVKGRLELNTQIQNLIAELKKKYESEKDNGK
jgi:hypothetical protein